MPKSLWKRTARRFALYSWHPSPTNYFDEAEPSNGGQRHGRLVNPRPASLLRQLGIGSATALVISNMIGTGILTTSGFLAGQLGSARLVLSIWGVGAVCALAGAFCYSELGVNFPSSGGEYVYLTEA